MKHGLALVLGMTLCWGGAAAQGVQLSWMSCFGTPGASFDHAFDCNPSDGRVYPLCGTFELSARASGIVTLQGLVDFRFRTADVPAFWHFETDGCNASGIVLSAARPPGCETYQAGWCDSTGTGCVPTLVSYVAGYGGPDRARLLLTLSRPQDQPRDLEAAPAKHFAFRLDFLMDRGTSCAGCNSMARITWSELDAYSAGGLVRTVLATDVDSWADAYANDLPVPARATTWGRLKALYR